MRSHSRSIGAAVAIACASLSHAGEPPTFPSADAAAIAAIHVVLPESECREYAGVILRHGNQFSATAPQRGAFETFTIRVTIPAGWSLAALYHTHPNCGAGDPTLFSPTDVSVARKLGVPSYIGVHADGSVRRFDPHASMTYRLSVPFGAVVSHGSIIQEG